jgi:hypothetical protein
MDHDEQRLVALRVQLEGRTPMKVFFFALVLTIRFGIGSSFELKLPPALSFGSLFPICSCQHHASQPTSSSSAKPSHLIITC